MKDTKQIRAEIKKDLGYNSRQVSVKLWHYTTLSFTIRDRCVDYKKLSDYVQKYESIDRDMVTGEILCGGNTYVDVHVDDKVVDLLQEIDIANVIEDMNSVEKDFCLSSTFNNEKILFRADYFNDVTAEFEGGERYHIGGRTEKNLRKAMYQAGLFSLKPRPSKIEWQIDLKVMVNGKLKLLSELPASMLDQLVNEVLAEGLKDRADGKFESIGA